MINGRNVDVVTLESNCTRRRTPEVLAIPIQFNVVSGWWWVGVCIISQIEPTALLYVEHVLAIFILI